MATCQWSSLSFLSLALLIFPVRPVWQNTAEDQLLCAPIPAIDLLFLELRIYLTLISLLPFFRCPWVSYEPMYLARNEIEVRIPVQLRFTILQMLLSQIFQNAVDGYTFKYFVCHVYNIDGVPLSSLYLSFSPSLCACAPTCVCTRACVCAFSVSFSFSPDEFIYLLCRSSVSNVGRKCPCLLSCRRFGQFKICWFAEFRVISWVHFLFHRGSLRYV